MQSYYFFTKRRNKTEKKYQLYLLNVHSFAFSYVLDSTIFKFFELKGFEGKLKGS